jgi:tripartite-type tricarboxylate transporter receptor subunit TctC
VKYRDCGAIIGGLGLIAAIFLAGEADAQPSAQSFPTRPIRVVVPYLPGGGNDNMGRLIAQKLTEGFKQQAFVDNRGGAAGRLGAENVARSAPDGHTLLMAGSTVMITAPALNTSLPYDIQKDFAPVTLVGFTSYVLVVHPAVPARNVQQFIALARSRAGALNYSSSGSGGPAHLAGELFQTLTRVKMVHVPYKGGSAAVVQLIAGEIDLTFGNIQPTAPIVRAGRLRALAVTSPKRSAVLPEVPTFAEAGVPGLEVSIYYGVLAPGATPPDIIARLNAVLVKGLNAPETRKRIEADGAELQTSTPEEFAKLIRTETEKWAKIIKAAGIKPEG